MIKSNKQTFHISWFSNVKKMDLRNPLQKREWLQMVLRRGTSRDIQKLNTQELKDSLSQLHLPSDIKNLWQNYFLHYSK